MEYRESRLRKYTRLALATWFGVNAFWVGRNYTPEFLKFRESEEPTAIVREAEPTTEELRNTHVKDIPNYLRKGVRIGQKLPK